ncbi:hypothetical protein [Streptomyces formicae]|uniref:Uncharacterized protein n=1 Tax=Streptomyces formicae TaxID=1616117 RepID=A0ABY3WVF6_9ACTN|nr:hypothetical protein [Streptomyces formicae]UNM13763.1 hypothetical protein J4032_21955 [Streptomyces formicae]
MWLEDDRAWALALQVVEADRCPDCGQPWDEATDPENEFKWRGHLAKCHACAAAARAIAQHENAGGDTRGVHVHVTRG